MTISKPVGLTIFALAAAAAVMPFDLAIAQYVNAHDACRPFFEAITDIGLGKWYVWPSGILALAGFALWKNKKLPERFFPAWHASVLIFIAVGGSGLLTDTLKRIFARARPTEFFASHTTGFFHWADAFGPHAYHFHSFPSGHTTTALSLAAAVTFLLPEKQRWLRIPVFVFAGILAVSRIMVSAHYTSDVIVGAVIGTWGAVIAHKILQNRWSEYKTAS